MLVTISVKAETGDVERYQELLRESWSRETFDEVLSLLRKLIGEGLNPTTHPWQKVLATPPARKSPRDFDPEILNRIRDLSSVFQDPSVPLMPAHFTATRANQAAGRAERAWAFLIVQGMANLEGATGFFADIQSLLYLCSAHVLLPQLKQQNHAAEHDCLACSMYIHTLLVWRGVPSHMFYLQNVLMDQLGDAERQLELLDLSFLLTPPEDHAYLTRATAYWSGLMNLRRYSEATRFLGGLMRHAPDSCHDEIMEMLSETVLEANNASG